MTKIVVYQILRLKLKRRKKKTGRLVDQLYLFSPGHCVNWSQIILLLLIIFYLKKVDYFNPTNFFYYI